VHVVEGGLHLHGVGVGAQDALALQPCRCGHRPHQIDDFQARLLIELGVLPDFGHVADHRMAQPAGLGVGANQGIDADHPGLWGIVAGDAAHRSVGEMRGQGECALAGIEPGVGRDDDHRDAGGPEFVGGRIGIALALDGPLRQIDAGSLPAGKSDGAEDATGHGGDVPCAFPGRLVDARVARRAQADDRDGWAGGGLQEGHGRSSTRNG
jgi:hypothetical protein